jgi:hypothetical protein
MFKLDLTDIYIRKQIAKTTKDDKVHRKQKTLIDNRMKGPINREKGNDEKTKDGKKKYLTITGTKATKNIEVEAVMDEDVGQTSTGILIDRIK